MFIKIKGDRDYTVKVTKTNIFLGEMQNKKIFIEPLRNLYHAI